MTDDKKFFITIADVWQYMGIGGWLGWMGRSVYVFYGI